MLKLRKAIDEESKDYHPSAVPTPPSTVISPACFQQTCTLACFCQGAFTDGGKAGVFTRSLVCPPPNNTPLF